MNTLHPPPGEQIFSDGTLVHSSSFQNEPLDDYVWNFENKLFKNFYTFVCWKVEAFRRFLLERRFSLFSKFRFILT